MKNGKVLHRKGYGVARIDKPVPISADTVFGLASCSKQFTAMAIMILEDRGKLKFDDDVREYLPELPRYDPKRPIRVLDLLHHTSGLPDYLDLLDEVKGDVSRVRNQHVAKLVARRKLDFPTGSKWAYSNTNYCLLALIVSRVARKPFHTFLRDEIFTPLGMKGAFVFEKKRPVVKSLAHGYVRKGDSFAEPQYGPMTSGDGAVRVSIADWEKWEKGLLEGKLVSKKTLQQAFEAGELDSGEKHRYGFGWLVGRGDGKLFVNHAGRWAGFSTYALRLVDDGLTVVVLSNLESIEAPKLGLKIALLFAK